MSLIHPSSFLKKISEKFIREDFLLQSSYAIELYHDYVKELPIIDYHNHLSPSEINRNRKFENITKAWLEGDHYKWRAMRNHGVDEHYITGEADDREKFRKWAGTVPYTLRNPLFQWTQLELLRYFGIDELLSESNADEIFAHCTGLLSKEEYRVRGLLKKMQVELVCTTDDPVSELRDHREFAGENEAFRMLPAFRPDAYILLEAPDYLNSLEKLAHAANKNIGNYQDLLDALYGRLDYFESNACQISDHGLNHLPYSPASDKEIETIFQKRLEGEIPAPPDAEKFHTHLLLFLCREYNRRSWVQQFHLGALRNCNSRLLKSLGADTGWDSIGDYPQSLKMSRFLDHLDREQALTRTILYNLNPSDNEVFATMCGNFNDGTVTAKMQLGSAWWFLDQLDGMEKQINSLSNTGLLSHFVGMLTDSRSFLSFPRHEYFRRLLCNIFARDVEMGYLPADIPWLGKILRDISYFNAKSYFGF